MFSVVDETKHGGLIMPFEDIKVTKKLKTFIALPGRGDKAYS